MPVGGHYDMLCFSDRQAGDWGPRRIRQEEIRDSFAEGWTVDSIQPAKIDITIDPHHAEALAGRHHPHVTDLLRLLDEE